MPNLTVELWDDHGRFVIATINVLCSEHQAQQLEQIKAIKRFLARKLPQGISRNMPYELFKKYFLR